MKKKIRPRVGDTVVTNGHFKPLQGDGTRYDMKGEILEGIIIGTLYDVWQIDFGKEFPFTHTHEGALESPTGYGLSEREFKVTQQYQSDDKAQTAFVNLLRERSYIRLAELPKKIAQMEQSARDKKYNIKARVEDIRIEQDRLLKCNLELKELQKSRQGLVVDNGVLEAEYKKLTAHKLIEDVQVLEDKNASGGNIIVTTKDLVYKNRRSAVTDFDLGAYKFLINTKWVEAGAGVLVVNYKKHLDKTYFHPCVPASFEPCLGREVGNHLYKLLEMGSYASLIYVLIDFLQEPDYNHPHCPEIDFSAAQAVTIRPRDPLKWFSREYWMDNEVWDAEAYTKQLRANKIKFGLITVDTTDNAQVA